MMRLLYLLSSIGLLGILVALFIYIFVKKKNEGSEKMRDIASQIHEGAMVFLRREYKIIGIFIVVVFFNSIFSNFFGYII